MCGLSIGDRYLVLDPASLAGHASMHRKGGRMWHPTDHMLGLRRNGVNHVGMEGSFRHQGHSEPVRKTTRSVRGLDARRATPELTLQPGEAFPLVLSSYAPDRPALGYAVRAIQYARSGAFTGLVGGQTFVVGEVEGFTPRRPVRRKGSIWPWVIASGTLLLLAAVLGRRAKVGHWRGLKSNKKESAGAVLRAKRELPVR